MDVIKTEGLTKEFKVGFTGRRFIALENLNLNIKHGEIFGFLGPNGAGKTTTIKLLLGLISPTAGNAYLLGKDIKDIAVKESVGFLPEQPYFYDYLTADEFLHFCGQLFNINRIDRKKRVDELLRIVKLEGSRGLQLRKFSKGMLQRIGIAQALINDPELVILDEPMSGLDPIGRKEIRDIILRLKEKGKTIFFSTHIIPDVEMICNRVGILVKGRLKAVGKLDELVGDSINSVEITAQGLSSEAIKKIEKLFIPTRKGKGIGGGITKKGKDVIITAKDNNVSNKIVALIQKSKGDLVSLIPQKRSLEEYFMEKAEE